MITSSFYSSSFLRKGFTRNVPRDVDLELPEEQRADSDIDDIENENNGTEENAVATRQRVCSLLRLKTT